MGKLWRFFIWKQVLLMTKIEIVGFRNYCESSSISFGSAKCNVISSQNLTHLQCSLRLFLAK